MPLDDIQQYKLTSQVVMYHPLHLYCCQVCKQADTVLAYFIFPGISSPDVMRRSLEYYEKITTHDSSLSTCIFSIVVSRPGLAEKTEQYFGNSLRADLVNTRHNTRNGIHTANMGGNCMAVVNGFAGLHIREDGFSLHPRLPARWTSRRFSFVWQKRQFSFEVNQTQSTLTLVHGNAVTAQICGKDYSFAEARDAVSVPLSQE